MKAMSIRNPWSYLIAWGIKDIENRSTRTKKIDERIYIHTSLTWVYSSKQAPCFTARQWSFLDEKEKEKLRLINLGDSLFTGAIIGEVTIRDCVEDHNSIWAEPGMYHWRLKDPVLYEKPILDVKGKLSFWEYNK